MFFNQKEKITMSDLIPVTLGFDQKEAIAYHVFCQSLIEMASTPLMIIPLAENTLKGFNKTDSDASNKFVYSRFLTPYLLHFEGWAIFMDGDMICKTDIADLWAFRDNSKAVMVAQHNYRTKSDIKYLGNKNEDYPRKNWSSVILWNCGHPKNKILTPAKIQESSGAFLHRFQWLEESEIGALPLEWNWLATEYENNSFAKIIHYTLGTPCFKAYQESEMAEIWYQTYARHNQGMHD